MRTLILKDITIPRQEFDMVLEEIKNLYKQHAEIDLQIEVEDRYFEHLPFEIYQGNYRGIKREFLDILARDVEFRFGKRFDQITIIVDDKNWHPARDLYPVWGWNISAGIRGYEIQQCRWDPNNPANSVGTIYHEMMHSHDGFCYRMLGGRVETILKVSDWDEDCVHGRHPNWSYIRHKENTEALNQIRYLLRLSIEQRIKQFNAGTPLLEKLGEGLREFVIKVEEPFAKR